MIQQAYQRRNQGLFFSNESISFVGVCVKIKTNKSYQNLSIGIKTLENKEFYLNYSWMRFGKVETCLLKSIFLKDHANKIGIKSADMIKADDCANFEVFILGSTDYLDH